MKFYFAPMEGITGYLYRNAHSRHFEKADKYFTPFLAPDKNRTFKTRELEDILPEHNKGLSVVPQILTNRAEDFIRAARELFQYGYREVNLNLGCPSGTVVSKGRGAGFLGRREELSSFFETVFSGKGLGGLNVDISVKTRIGVSAPEEFSELLEIFNRFPISELTIHPRTQKDYYKNEINLAVFGDAVAGSRHPLCYNGDLCSISDYRRFVENFPSVEAVMIGRGLVSNPALLGLLKGKKMPEKKVLKEFHDELYESYQEVLPGQIPVLFKMKEVWSYLSQAFSGAEKQAKRIKKAKSLSDYEAAVASLFYEAEMIDKIIL